MAKTLSERAVEAGLKAFGRLMEDPKRAERVASAMASAGRAKERLSNVQAAALHAASFVTRADIKDAGKRLSKLRRRGVELNEKLDRLAHKLKVN